MQDPEDGRQCLPKYWLPKSKSKKYIFPTVKSALLLLFDISLMSIIRAFLSYDFFGGGGRPSILVRGTGTENEQGEPENEKSLQNRD